MKATLQGAFKITRDVEMRSTPDGTPVITLSLAMTYGIKKDPETGFLPTQFLEAGIWGERARQVGQYLNKGDVVHLVISELHNEVFQRRDNTEGVKMTGRVEIIDLLPQAERKDSDQATRPAQRQAASPSPRPAPRPAPAQGSGFDDMDDDLPF